ncbi:MAG TPA: FAD-dependent oxidoreductase [Steroidobacteraceae bacterium]|nr:FAD-dependent oxidoreductase [Steroidobacteraceae bacterium]
MAEQYDVVVVGAGIHGAGCAQAAAAAGHSVLLLEQRAIACGSSSRSSKLIHGGLRYLESGQFRLVRESLHERTHLLRLAPTLVHLKRFYIPIYRHTRRRPWQLRIGLTLYALLAGLDPTARFGTVPRSEWRTLDGLDTRGLQRVFWYHDAQTDDRLLTEAVVKSAQSLGAQLRLPAEFVGATLGESGAVIRWRDDSQREQQCEARVLINAAGPWADRVARLITPRIGVPQLQLVRGTHLILPGSLTQGIYYVESPRDGRAIFVMPWHGDTLLGTTEAAHHGDPGAVVPSPSEINYLLGIAKHYFPRWRPLGQSDLKGLFAGLRVLPGGPGHAFHRSRETLLVPERAQRPRVLSIYGGKLTTWRAVAARALAQVAPSLPPRSARADTLQLRLEP